ncbi:hypothetical protein [Thermococcus zilligii]|uniref:hypothetical protein n=1 Tax=Thermococcus zilligii TaxID=54076 RepID=UPI001ED8F80D|nr:hypothetical protein [Thermococcus zilligii]
MGEKVRPDNKFALIVYLWGSIAGVISGLLSTYYRPGWVIGALMFLATDLFVKLLLGEDLPRDIKELPEDGRRKAILRRAFWGWLLFWLYFTMLVYTLGIGFEPKAYNNQSLLSKMMNGTGR